jgi:hypothetical protein
LLEINREEAEKLATAMLGVMKYHSINISPGTLAWLQLAGVSVVVYGPRVALTMAAKKAAKPEKSPVPAQVGPASGIDFGQQEPGKIRFN